MDIPWHNWFVLDSESPNIYCLGLFGIIRLQETFEKKIGDQQKVPNMGIP
jgi:hypothetical protein